MLRELSARHRSWPLAAPFRISRGVKHSAEAVVVEIHEGGCRGRAESVPYARYGETIESVLQQIESRSEEHTSELQSLMRISYAVFCLKKKKRTEEDRTE